LRDELVDLRRVDFFPGSVQGIIIVVAISHGVNLSFIVCLRTRCCLGSGLEHANAEMKGGAERGSFPLAAPHLLASSCGFGSANTLAQDGDDQSGQSYDMPQLIILLFGLNIRNLSHHFDQFRVNHGAEFL
jgi:hypothetical protein